MVINAASLTGKARILNKLETCHNFINFSMPPRSSGVDYSDDDKNTCPRLSLSIDHWFQASFATVFDMDVHLKPRINKSYINSSVGAVF